MNRKIFFDSVRPMFALGRMTAKQVEGTEAKLDAFEATPLRREHMAYMLATAFHETAQTMQPIEEIGHGHGKPYGQPAGPYGHVYYGRGDVQLSWLDNYIRARKELGADFVAHPELALEPQWAAQIMIRGMVEGWFTGKKLSDTLNDKKTDWVQSRRIINKLDKAGLIAGYARKFDAALKGALA